MAQEQFTAETLQSGATDEYGTYVLHRHHGDHVEGGECWCFPLTLTYRQLIGLSPRALQSILDTHYRTH